MNEAERVRVGDRVTIYGAEKRKSGVATSGAIASMCANR